MSISYADGAVELHHGDCLAVLRTMPDASVDAVVTDPPYGLADHHPQAIADALSAWLTGDREHVPDGRGFMGREWDRFVPPPAVWDECLRVLKPGGWLLAFAGSRTADLMGISVRLAGFEIRDGIDWLYGSGFPKSLDVSKAIDKAARGELVRAKLRHFAAERGIGGRWLEERGVASAASFADWTVGGHVPSDRNWQIVKAALEVSAEEEAAFERVALAERTRKATGRMAQGEGGYAFGEKFSVTAPATEDAARWSGWGTALKPAREPIVMARKPLAGTVAATVLAYGTGALNIDACRVGDEQRTNQAGGASSLQRVSRVEQGYRSHVTASVGETSTVTGRWPSNVVLSHAPDCREVCDPGCPVAEMDQQSGATVSRIGVPRQAASGDGWRLRATGAEYTDAGGASRFFPVFRYEAKAGTAERPRTADGVSHPTVKPLDLMRWLVRLVTPVGGTVLEPFAGSGTTAEACVLEGFRCIAVERDASYLPLIAARLSKPLQPALDLFGDAA